MGVIHKLKPEIIDFILRQKKVNPGLSCRGISALIKQEFLINLSKSSINAIIKSAGLSMPVGRRQRRKKRSPQLPAAPAPVPEQVESPPQIPAEREIEEEPQITVEKEAEEPYEAECTGAILLKAVDCLIGASPRIAKAVKTHLAHPADDLLAKTEALIYLPLFNISKDEKDNSLAGLWPLLGKELSLEGILSYLQFLQGVRAINLEILKVIPDIFQEVRCVKIFLSDGKIVYLDGQLRTIWSTPYVPYNFSATLYNAECYINRHLYGDSPFVLFMAPGDDAPTEEFFNFILSLDGKERDMVKMIYYGNKLEELKAVPLMSVKKHFFVFGLWAWQFRGCRKVNKIGEFKPFNFAGLKKDFVVAEIEVILSQPYVRQEIKLRGYAVKTTLQEQIPLIILSNFPAHRTNPEEMISLYLSHWPNLQEGFEDMKRKIELFTYLGASQRFFSVQGLQPDKAYLFEKKEIFDYCLQTLDSYFKWHFLPLGYEDKDFSTIKERFYSLKAILKKDEAHALATFKPPQGYQHLKELEYTCRRLNEREICLGDGRRLWFEV